MNGLQSDKEIDPWRSLQVGRNGDFNPNQSRSARAKDHYSRGTEYVEACSSSDSQGSTRHERRRYSRNHSLDALNRQTSILKQNGTELYSRNPAHGPTRLQSDTSSEQKMWRSSNDNRITPESWQIPQKANSLFSPSESRDDAQRHLGGSEGSGSDKMGSKETEKRAERLKTEVLPSLFAFLCDTNHSRNACLCGSHAEECPGSKGSGDGDLTCAIIRNDFELVDKLYKNLGRENVNPTEKNKLELLDQEQLRQQKEKKLHSKQEQNNLRIGSSSQSGNESYYATVKNKLGFVVREQLHQLKENMKDYTGNQEDSVDRPRGVQPTEDAMDRMHHACVEEFMKTNMKISYKPNRQRESKENYCTAIPNCFGSDADGDEYTADGIPTRKRDLCGEIFLWTLLHTGTDLSVSLFFWQKTREPLAAALFGQKLLRRLGGDTSRIKITKKLCGWKTYPNNPQRQSILWDYSLVYKKMAKNILDFYTFEKEPALEGAILSEFLVTQSNNWGGLSPMALAYRCRDVQFLGHASCWAVTQQIWSKSNSSFRRCSLRNAARIIFSICSPQVSFFVSLLFHFLFVSLYSYVLLRKFVPSPLSSANVQENGIEVFLLLYVCGMALEEVRQLCHGGEYFHRYLSSRWNNAEVLAILFYIIGIIFQHSCPLYEWALLLRALALLLFILLILRYMCFLAWVGTIVPLLGQMTGEFFRFFAIIILFNTAYTISMQALINPMHQLKAEEFNLVVLPPYSYVYGDAGDSFLQGSHAEEACSNKTIPTSLTTDWVYPFGRLIQIIITNFMLFNILIAIFNSKYNEIIMEAEAHYRHQFLQLTKEYYYHSWLPSPFCLLAGLTIIFHWPSDPFNKSPKKSSLWTRSKLSRKMTESRKMTFFHLDGETLKRLVHDSVNDSVKDSEASTQSQSFQLNIRRTLNKLDNSLKLDSYKTTKEEYNEFEETCRRNMDELFEKLKRRVEINNNY